MSRVVETHNAVAGLVQLYQGLIADLSRELVEMTQARDTAATEHGKAYAEIGRVNEIRENLNQTMQRQSARIAELERRCEVLTARLVVDAPELA